MPVLIGMTWVSLFPKHVHYYPDLEKAGFQLSARTEDGNQYGVFQTIDDRTLIQSNTDGTIQYMNHSQIGSEVDEGMANWKFKWTSGSGTGNIVFNLAGNAANGDASEFGDATYVYEIVLVRYY